MDILTEVKQSLGITGTYQDDLITNYINEVKEYMVSAGVSQAVANSDKAIGVISRGVSDLWNYGSAGGTLSNYFMQRVIQLSYQTQNTICFNQGDYGVSFPVLVKGMEVLDSDTLTFICDDIIKDCKETSDNCILITFTKEESEKLIRGVYDWCIKLQRDTGKLTLINGLLIVE